MANIVMFSILAVLILGSAVMSVMTKSIMRAATWLLFVLFGIAGLYFLLDYTFLGAAQISIYAGGITVMYVVAVILMKNEFIDKAVQMADVEVPMQQIGQALVGSEKFGYVLPFEFISVFLLACIVGGVMIARKEDEK